MLCLVTKSLLECLENVSLDVVGMELGFVFLVLVQLVTHVLLQPFFFDVNLRLGGVVVSLFFIILALDLGEFISEST